MKQYNLFSLESMKYPASLSVLLPSVGCCSLWLLAIVDIPEYYALSEAIVKLTGEGMGKIVNYPQND